MDGGVIDRIPVSVVKELGADIVIAVDVSPIKVNGDVTSIYDVIMQSIEIMQHEPCNESANCIGFNDATSCRAI